MQSNREIERANTKTYVQHPPSGSIWCKSYRQRNHPRGQERRLSKMLWMRYKQKKKTSREAERRKEKNERNR